MPQFEQRFEESRRILENCPDKVPIICEKDPNSKLQNELHSKFLVPGDFTAFEFCKFIRRGLRLNEKESLFFFVNETIILNGNTTMSEVYQKRKNSDGFLYITYTDENVTGFD